MIHKIYRMLSCKPLPEYKLEIVFDDGLKKIVDLRLVLAGKVYSALLDEKLFAEVQIDPESGVPVWPNGCDFDPTILHDWELHSEDFTRTAKKWGEFLIA